MSETLEKGVPVCDLCGKQIAREIPHTGFMLGPSLTGQRVEGNLYSHIEDVIERAYQRVPVDSWKEDLAEHNSQYAQAAAKRILRHPSLDQLLDQLTIGNGMSFRKWMEERDGDPCLCEQHEAAHRTWEEEKRQAQSVSTNQAVVDAVEKTLPADVLRLLQHFGSGLCVAGGFCRDALLGEEPKDVDIFGTSEAIVKEAVEWFKSNATGYRLNDWEGLRPAEPDYALFRGPRLVQFVYRCYYATHEALIQSFDWSVCQCAFYWNGERWEAISTQDFNDHIKDRILHYTDPERDEDPGASVLRMVKMTRRGFTPTEASLARCLGRLTSQIVHGDRDKEEEYGMKIRRAFTDAGYMRAELDLVPVSAEQVPSS